MKHADLECFRCGTGFISPGGRVIFSTYGTYGSVVYDSPVSLEEHLEIVVCDDCMVLGGRRGNIMQCLPPVEEPPSLRQRWDPDYNPYAGVTWEEKET